MKHQLISQSEQRTEAWSGGKTTEIFIYPKGANYAERQFSWRVSTASVELDESDFSQLYGVKRWIMPFDAPLLLKHKNQQKLLYEIHLKPYETHCFKGDWDTKSIGKSRDFNLMLKEGSYGILKHFKFMPENSVGIQELFPEIFDDRLAFSDKLCTMGIYNIRDSFNAEFEGEMIEVKPQELMMFHNKSNEIIEFKKVIFSHSNGDYINLIAFFVAYEAQE